MGKIVTIASQKGGVGKTTTALNLGYSLSRLGSRVLLVDCDPQGGMTIATNLKKRSSLGLIDMLKNGLPRESVVMSTRDSTLAVAGIGRLEPEDVFLLEESSRTGTFAAAIREIAQGFDYVILDAPAGIGGIVTALLSVSDSVILVLVSRMLSLKTLPSFLSLTRWVRDNRNASLKLEGVLLTMFDINNKPELLLHDELKESLPAEVFFKTAIPADQMFESASIKSIPVAMLPGGSMAAKAYMDLTLELKEREFLAQTGGNDGDIAGLF